MNKVLFRKIQFISNIALIISAVALTAVTVKYIFFQDVKEETYPRATRLPTAATNPAANPTGKSIPLQDIDWSQNKKTLVMYLSNTCRYCSESAPFYQRLVDETASKNIKMVAVLPQSLNDSKDYLKTLDVKVDDIYQGSFDSIGVRGTPTLLLVNENGVVTDYWVGKLPAGRETQVLSKL